MDEANFVADRILTDCTAAQNCTAIIAVLYRMNAQSNALEYAFKRNGIPYRIIGGTRFFDRAEVKDMLAYLCRHQQPCGRSAPAPHHQSAAARHRQYDDRARAGSRE